MYASICKLALFFLLVVNFQWKKYISEVTKHTRSWRMQDLSWSTGNSVQTQHSCPPRRFQCTFWKGSAVLQECCPPLQAHPRWQRRKQRCVYGLLIPSNSELQTDWKITGCSSRECLSSLDLVPAGGLYVPSVMVTHTPDIKCKRLQTVFWTESWHTF